jgi:hypothetical protein
MRNEEQKRNGDRNLLVVVCVVVVSAAVVAVTTSWICSYVLDGFASSETMVLLITDAGLKSDDQKLEGQLTTATIALRTCRDLAMALAVGCGMVGAAAGWRVFGRRSA